MSDWLLQDCGKAGFLYGFPGRKHGQDNGRFKWSGCSYDGRAPVVGGVDAEEMPVRRRLVPAI